MHGCGPGLEIAHDVNGTLGTDLGENQLQVDAPRVEMELCVVYQYKLEMTRLSVRMRSSINISISTAGSCKRTSHQMVAHASNLVYVSIS